MSTTAAMSRESGTEQSRSTMALPIRGLIGDPVRDWEHSADLQALWANRGGRAAFEHFALGQLACDGGYGFDPLAPTAGQVRGRSFLPRCG